LTAGRADHYYSPEPASASRRLLARYELPDGQRLDFITDSGVFSKHGVDFGTDLLIRALPPLKGRVLDMGCGYGAIGIAAARMNPGADVWMADVNERAAELCRMNWRRCMAGREEEAVRRVVVSDGFEGIGGMFDYIAMNPPVRSGKARVFELFAQCRGRLDAGGALYIVIQKKQGLRSAADELARLFGGCRDIARRAGYHEIGRAHV
jgi:16S rRNA (guanine1207-N2)-methyltransferase